MFYYILNTSLPSRYLLDEYFDDYDDLSTLDDSQLEKLFDNYKEVMKDK